MFLSVASIPMDGHRSDVFVIAIYPLLPSLLWDKNGTCLMTDWDHGLLVLEGTTFSISTYPLLHFVHIYRVSKLITLIVKSKIPNYTRRIKAKSLTIIL